MRSVTPRVLWVAGALALIGASGCGGEVTTGSGGSGGAGGTTPTTSGQGGGGQGAGGPCSTDADCPAGEQWCVSGACEPCNNSGLACDIVCVEGWMLLERNGCHPCECAPVNDCTSDAGCGAGQECYAGQLCWDWCPAGDPSCCYGNTCSQAGCGSPNPSGCYVTGCPAGYECADVASECSSSGCACDGSGWVCTPDCNGGTCVNPL